jgi:hypothetical protein
MAAKSKNCSSNTHKKTTRYRWKRTHSNFDAERRKLRQKDGHKSFLRRVYALIYQVPALIRENAANVQKFPHPALKKRRWNPAGGAERPDMLWKRVGTRVGRAKPILWPGLIPGSWFWLKLPRETKLCGRRCNFCAPRNEVINYSRLPTVKKFGAIRAKSAGASVHSLCRR